MERSASDPEDQRSRRPKLDHDDAHRHGMAYFVPGQVMLFVEHEPRRDADWIVEQAQQELRALAGDQDRYCPSTVNRLIASLDRLRGPLDERGGAVLTYPPQKLRYRSRNARAVSAVFADLSETRNQRPTEDQELIRLFDYLNRRIITSPRERGPLTLLATSPNWLASSAQPGITGGPGARPVPAPDVPPSGVLGSRAVPSAAHEINMWEFTLPPLPSGRSGATAQEAGHDVEVAILDTAPSREAFAHARTLGLHKSHPLLRAMMGSGGMPREGAPNGRATAGKLSITYANDLGIDLDLREPYFVAEHNYPMPDHGLFVAGIINSIAPQAKLHLIEVLNSRGVGTLQGLLQALQVLLDRRTSTRLVVNCSLMVNMPLPGHPRINLDWPALEMDCRLIGLLSSPAQRIFDLLFERFGANVHVVAAAGNDAQGTNRPQARLPAALDRVIGVGALDADRHPASYSNLADTPMRIGIATFGGVTAQGAADARTGMLGTYIGAFPPGPPSAHPHGGAAPNGWARWAGTSFAAPVISGTLAMLVGQGIAPDFAQAERIVRNVEADRTDAGEEIFSVKQGVAQPAAQNVPV